jgi:hypothetical protein
VAATYGPGAKMFKSVLVGNRAGGMLLIVQLDRKALNKETIHKLEHYMW